MFKKKLDYILVLKPMKIKNSSKISSIHTCFMRMNIDLVFLNKNKEIFEITSLKPWKFYTPKQEAAYILELKEGNVKKYEIKIGDQLDFVCENS
jgi:uncharacterized membrane protein (UPF0127 family)